jgi:hypothetical protein
VPTKLATAPTTVATLVTSVHLNVDIRVIKKTRANPVMMIQKPYLSLSRSTSSAADVVVVVGEWPAYLLKDSSYRSPFPQLRCAPSSVMRSMNRR